MGARLRVPARGERLGKGGGTVQSDKSRGKGEVVEGRGVLGRLGLGQARLVHERG